MNDTTAAVLVIGLLLNLILTAMSLWRQGSLDNRLTILETHRADSPTHRDLTEIRQAIAQVASSVSGLSERTSVITGMVGTIQKHLLEEDD